MHTSILFLFLVLTLGGVRLLTDLYYFFITCGCIKHFCLAIIIVLLAWFLTYLYTRYGRMFFHPELAPLSRSLPIYRQVQGSLIDLHGSLIDHRFRLTRLAGVFDQQVWYQEQIKILDELIPHLEVLIQNWVELPFCRQLFATTTGLIIDTQDLFDLMLEVFDQRYRVLIEGAMLFGRTWQPVQDLEEVQKILERSVDLGVETKDRFLAQVCTILQDFERLCDETKTAIANADLRGLEERVDDFVEEVEKFKGEVAGVVGMMDV